MKKWCCLLLVLTMLGCAAVPVCAEEVASAEVAVTIAKQGELVVTQKTVTVTDTDEDGALTVSDALYAAHEAAYEGGAVAGYNAYVGDYGLSLGKLWGDDSGNFSYYKNDASCVSLAETVADGDAVVAFIYADTATYSDTYTYFSENKVSAVEDGAIELTLSAAGYDASWNPVTLPVEGAVITVGGEATDVVTDAEGKATVTIEAAGTYVISAISESQTLVPPVCTVTVTAAASEDKIPATGETATAVGAAFAVLTLTGAALMLTRKQNHAK